LIKLKGISFVSSNMDNCWKIGSGLFEKKRNRNIAFATGK
jgi:hypothetical protein